MGIIPSGISVEEFFEKTDTQSINICQILLSDTQFPPNLQNGGLLDPVEFTQFGYGGVVAGSDFAEGVALAHGVVLRRTGTAG